VDFDVPLDDTFDCGISLDDFYEPANHIDSNVDSEIFTNSNLDSEIHNGFANNEMCIGDEHIENEIRLEDLLDEHNGSDMSLDDDVESITGIDSAYTCPRVTPHQVYVAFSAESSAAAAARRPTQYPCTVTMPDGVTTLTITEEMAVKADKVIKECTMMPANSTLEEMLTYQYFNWQESLRLKNYRATLEERRRQASLSSQRRKELSLGSTRQPTPRPRSRLASLPEHEKAQITRNLSFMTEDTDGIPVPKTTAGALFSVGAYLKALQPPADDPAAALHRQQLKSLALAAKALQPADKTPAKGRDRDIIESRHSEHNRSGRSHRSDGGERSSRRHRSSRSRSRRSYSSDSYSDREPEPCGALCFTRRIRETRIPKGFKLTGEQPKYNGRQEPSGWLEDYRLAVACQRGTNTTAMQYIRLMLEGTARDWLKALPPSSYDSWDDFRRDFIKNFEPLCERPKTFEELRACKQRSDETLRSYIRRWTEIRNSVGTISEDRAMDAFTQGLARKDFREALGREKPSSLAQLIKNATEWADGEDSVRRSRASPPRDNHDSGSRSRRDSYRDDRRRKRSKRPYDDDRPEFMAAGYTQSRDDQDRSNRRSDDRRDS